MENENELPQVAEEIQVEEETTIEPEQIAPQEESVTMSKAELNRLTRKAIAYDTIKKNPPIIKQESQVDSVDLIKLGKKLQDYSDEELDFATELAKSKKPEDILKALENPFLQAGIKAQREKVEKEKLTLKPSGTQPESEVPQSLEERLENARTDREKQEILEEYGLYSEPHRRTDGPTIRV
jgi:ADP-dependent phosphofructokinase/glucokinase